MLKGLDDDNHVKTRVCQYEASKDDRAFEIAKQFVKSKIEGQNIVLKKYGLKMDTSVKLRIDAIKTEDLKTLRRKLMQIEAKFSQLARALSFSNSPTNPLSTKNKQIKNTRKRKKSFVVLDGT